MLIYIARFFALLILLTMIWVGHHISWARDSAEPVIPIIGMIASCLFLLFNEER